jgi:hypothetical protein
LADIVSVVSKSFVSPLSGTSFAAVFNGSGDRKVISILQVEVEVEVEVEVGVEVEVEVE